jgi:hypothetical protein
MSEIEVFIPLTEYLPEDAWPQEVAGVAGGALSFVAWEGGTLLAEEDHLYADAALRVVRDLVLELPAGLAVVVGEGPVRAQLEADPERFLAAVHADVLRLRLPRSLFVPVREVEGGYQADPDPARFVEVALPFGATLDQAGNFDFIFPAGEGELALPPFMVGETGIVLSAEGILIRLSELQPLPEGAEEMGLPSDWRGIFIRSATIHLPPHLRGKVAPTRVSLRLGIAHTQTGAAAFDVGISIAAAVVERIPLGETGVAIEAGEAEVSLSTNGAFPIGEAEFWKRLVRNARVTVTGFRAAGAVIPGGALAGDLQVVFRDGKLDSAQSYLRRHEPDDQHLAAMGLRNVSLGDGHLAVTWSEPRVNDWLGKLAPGLADDAAPAEHELTVRVLWNGSGVREVRLDWQIEGGSRRLRLPGINVDTPQSVRVSVLLGPGGAAMSRLALALTFTPASGALTASSDFAWERGGDRELQNDTGRPPDAGPLFQLTLAPDPGEAGAVTLVLMEMDVTEVALPKFLRQLQAQLGALDYADAEGLGRPTPWTPVSLRGDQWDATFRINADRVPFDLPFLKQEEEKPEDAAFPQLLKVDRPRLDEIQVRFDEHTVTVPVGITLDLGEMDFSTDVEVGFDWERFALAFSHEGGIEMVSELPAMPEQTHLGLVWRLKGAPVTAGPRAGKFSYFTLVTKDHDYQVVQTPGAAFQIAYTGISDEPITFMVSDFAVTARGISLNAVVTDQPAKLNGIDTRFRFVDTRIEIRENRIADFTLAGSGPLPPALVGDATADLALQFGQRGGGLTLIAGSARLRGSKLLDCRGTRFRFSVDGLGVKFVNDGRYHLYFTVTGSAEFVPGAGDDANGPLALLGKIRIDLVEAPLSGDVKVLAKHVRFLVELPKPKSFSFLGAFEMELRGIGFVPSAQAFGGDPAMMLTGQLKFAQGAGDTPDSRTDLHTLFIGLPKPGTFIPRIHFKDLPVHLNVGAAFRLNGVVEFVDTPQEKGFTGEGVLQIQGMPTIAASFAFLRVRRDESAPWVRAWFIYIEVRQVSFPIPVVQLYLREVGLGFGYRYTLAAIKAADRENDVRKLLASLKTLSRTAGDLSKRDRWAVDLEDPGQDPRWTIVFRALISQTSASPSPLRWNEAAEKEIACTFLFDAVIAFRSDLTFLMAVRAWLNANYYDYVSDYKGLRGKPLLSGFVLLSPRQKRLLANVSSNPDGQLGPHPPLPEFMQKALTGAQFSATLLIEPGLLHYELGWPNMLRWSSKVGPLNVDFRGGFIFRISRRELVTGASFLARGSLEFSAGIDLGIVGARVSATANVAYGARYIGVVKFQNTASDSALYAGVGVELHVNVSVEFWIKLKIGFVKIKKSFRFSLSIDFTAGLEVGFVGISPTGIGVRGRGTLAVKCMGRRLQLSVNIGLREEKVAEARRITDDYLKIGLEATDVEGIPGTNGSGSLAPASAAPSAISAAGGTAAAFTTAGGTATFATAGAGEGLLVMGLQAVQPLTDEAPQSREEALRRALEDIPEGFEIPDYSVFVVRLPKSDDEADEEAYFVLIPQGERVADGAVQPERGFLPAPPDAGVVVESDFAMDVPAGEYALRQWAPGQGWQPRAAGQGFTWKVNWDATVAKGTEHPLDELGQLAGDPKENQEFKLADYLVNAFITREVPVGDEGETRPVAHADPDPLPAAEGVADERVHSPSDAVFESAVRGAAEQFRGSPFFKRDPSSEYERVLDRAFQDTTTVYTEDGQVPVSEADKARMQLNEQAHQLRGMVVHDLVADLREYAEKAVAATEPEAPADSVAFAMGLVFHAKGRALPAWLEAVVAKAELPSIRQRTGPGDGAADGAGHPVRAFNVRDTDFGQNSPQFQRVQQLTDAGTVAVAWTLVWEHAPEVIHTPSQADPEEHLAHYHVRRRALSGEEREAVFTIKPAEALSRGKGGLLQALAPRFQLVDHFTHETAEELAALPEEGRSYLYTITPVDFAGNAGRPLTVVATRYPDEPPAVPTDAELVVAYRLGAAELDPAKATDPVHPVVVSPAAVHVEWSEPAAAPGAPPVAIAGYRLVFRRDATLPIGSYGLDGGTQGPRAKRLPTSNARPLRTDVRIGLRDIETEVTPEGRRIRRAWIDQGTLQDAGVLPGEAGVWRPESWRVFIQTESLGKVPSALAPVQLLLRAEPAVQDDDEERRVEERRPADLEWLPMPIRFPLLPPEDERAVPGPAHVPMPAGELTFRVDAAPAAGYRAHPGGQRCIRFRWNQGPSARRDYPLDLNAGFHLLELDVDAHTAETFADRDRLAGALRTLQEVQMVPAEDLLLTPGDTLATGQWEAWYPSTVRRLSAPAARARGSELPLGPWLSWRESVLVWPEWPGLTDDGVRDDAVHPFLRRLLRTLDENLEKLTGADGEPLQTYALDLQSTPPMVPGSLADFFRASAPAADPYGWGVLQRFGVSVTVSLRHEKTGAILRGPELTAALQAALRALLATLPDAERVRLQAHLHVELLFQPRHAIHLQADGADAEGLLGLVQLSLRPTAIQPLAYARLGLRGSAGATTDLVFILDAGTTVDLIDQNDPALGQVEMKAEGGVSAVIARTVRLPVGGETTLLLRGARIPSVGVLLRTAPADPAALAGFADTLSYRVVEALHTVVLHRPLGEQTPEQRARLRAALGDDAALESLLRVATRLEPFEARDECSTYFTVSPATLAERFGGADPAAVEGAEWRHFRRYALSLASNDPALPAELRLEVPESGTALLAVLPDFLSWSQRFFDHGPDVDWENTAGRAQARPGPWLATAYPRAGSPAYATPDAGGRLTYDHLVEDRYAHAFRYYVRPFGRYDLLWQSLRQSPALGEGRARLEMAGPDPEKGGLDVVLDRTQPVAMPLVLGSRRLDPPATPQHPAAPGSTWEVLVAQHPEQALAERNSTLARQLAFQQVVFTLLRRFAAPRWVDDLSALTESTVVVRTVEDVHPGVPASYPARPDHLELAGPLDDADARTLDVPLRTGAFRQGAMALQWDALPFFYEHKLLLAAQTAGTVSAVNEVVQRDFEYRTPDPAAFLSGAAQAWTPAPPFGPLPSEEPMTVRARELAIPLRMFWDALPAAAQTQWAAEKPDDPASTGTRRKPASLPDPEVVYQVVERFTGNVEVQAELFYDATVGRYATRQLGRRFLVDVSRVEAPPATRPQGDFVLRAVVQAVAEERLTRAMPREKIPASVRPRVAVEGTRLFFAGTMTAADRTALLEAQDGGTPLFAGADRDTIERIHQEGFSTETVSAAVPLPAGMADRASLAQTAETVLVWAGPLSDADRAALLALPGDPEFRGALERLAAAVRPDAEAARVTVARGLERRPAGLEGLTLSVDEAAGAYSGLAWRGPLTDDALAVLRGWTAAAPFQAGVDAIVRTHEETVVRVPLPEEAQPPAALPEVLRAALTVGEGSLAWRGRVRSRAQLDALAAPGGDEAFAVAVGEVRTQLLASEAAAPFTLPRRPTQTTLPAALRARLTLGDAALRYHGVMSREDAAVLAALFMEPADAAAVDRLYTATLNAGMRGRTLGIRARRGSAAPSTLNPIHLEPR